MVLDSIFLDPFSGTSEIKVACYHLSELFTQMRVRWRFIQPKQSLAVTLGPRGLFVFLYRLLILQLLDWEN